MAQHYMILVMSYESLRENNNCLIVSHSFHIKINVYIHLLQKGKKSYILYI